MKAPFAVIAVLLWPLPALSATVCVDPHKDYEVRFLAGHDVVARQTIGHGRGAVRLTTSCIDLRKDDAIRLSTAFGCVGLGDTVVAAKIDGHRETCRVTHIAPYVPAPGQPFSAPSSPP